MKKLVITILIVVLLVLFLAPGAVGYVAQWQHRAMLDQIEQQDPNGEIVVEEYERTWFGSNARYSYRPDLSQRPDLAEMGDIRILVDSRIEHGPYPLAALKRTGLL